MRNTNKAIAAALSLTVVAVIVAGAMSMRAGAASVNGDEAAIRSLVQEAYIEGLFHLADLDKTRAGFHPDFVLLGVRDGQLTRLPIAEWIASAEKRKASGQKPTQTRCNFASIDIVGIAAVAKVELHQDGKHIFTDYLSLYKFDDGWRMVGKIFHRH
jgi:ketosteroid isomerase-like protein